MNAPEPYRRHEPTDECDGKPPTDPLRPDRFRWCRECDAWLCSCEIAFGHDCEVNDNNPTNNQGDNR